MSIKYVFNPFTGELDVISEDGAGGETVNIEALTGNKTLVAGTDSTVQLLDANGADRSITLQTTGSPTVGSVFTILNTTANATNQLNIFSGATKIDEAYGQETAQGSSNKKKFMYDGTAWIGIYPGSATSNSETSLGIGRLSKASNDDCTAFGVMASTSGDDGTAIGKSATTTGSDGTALGSGANAEIQSTAVGFNANADGGSVAMGRSSSSGASSVAVGNAASSGSGSTCLGSGANDSGQDFGNAIGFNSECERYGETVISTDNAGTQKYSRSQFGLFKATADASPIEITVRNVAAKRITVQANSAFMFSATVIAYNNAGVEGRTWKLEGGIKRDGAGNTTLIGTVVKTSISNDGGGTAAWDVAATADNTNEALIFTVTGEAATTIRWQAIVNINEVRF